MRILVTGAGGFVGRHAVREFRTHGHEPVAFDAGYGTPMQDVVETLQGDLRDPDAVDRAVVASRPDACLHLGGISFVPAGQSDPAVMMAVNVAGTVHVLDAVVRHAAAARVLVISSSHAYGSKARVRPMTEDEPLMPESIYGMSKAAADLTTLNYARERGIHAMTARPNNHTGPGQSPRFVVPSFAEQVRAVASGAVPGPVHVGNLESERDITDVRDVVRAYRLLLEKGQAGQAYNISSHQSVSVGRVLETLFRLAGVKAEIEVDPARVRPTDRSPLLDTSRLFSHTGWKPEIALETTLRDVLAG